jgi:hypothetical protein
MKLLSSDTTLETQRKQFELMRRLTPEQRLSMAFSLTDATRQLVLADLSHRFPQANDDEIRLRFIARVLSRHEVISAYGFDPRAKGF